MLEYRISYQGESDGGGQGEKGARDGRERIDRGREGGSS